ncbi:hypothetical protein ACX0G9_27105 [Flavitalea flava]
MKKANESQPPIAIEVATTYHPGLILKQIPSINSFRQYIYGENKVYSALIIFLMICQFIVFKLLYPFPDFFSDSYSYLYAAYAHMDVNIWPIGYSKFLLIFHWFTHSAKALIFFQYMFLEVTALYFYHTIVYFYNTGKNTRIILCLFLFFNPLFLYLSNYVTSDAIFTGLSLIWLTQLIWIIRRPKLYMVFVQSLVMFIAFTFRYNAMYYPIISAFAFLMSQQQNWIKAAGIISGPILILPFILFSSEAAKKMTGTAQFPPILGGWQWGNNALYIREYIDVDSTKFPTPETAELDRIAREFYRTIPASARELPSYVANFFIRQPEAPLKQYKSRHYSPQTNYEDVVSWGKVAPIFGQYGIFLIKQHPIAYARYFILVNTKNYFLPPLEKLEIYNLGLDEISPIAAFWFDYSSLKIKSISKTLQGAILFIYTGLFMAMNLYFLGNLVLFFRKNGLKNAPRFFSYSIIIISSFLFLNFCFSVFANIIVIRYQVFPMIIFLAFSMLLTDWLDLAAPEKKKVHVPSSASIQPEIS